MYVNLNCGGPMEEYNRMQQSFKRDHDLNEFNPNS